MTGRDDARCDQVRQVLDGGGDPFLDRQSRQVVSAQQQVDRLPGQEPEGFESDVDDPGMGARGEDGCSPAADASRKEALLGLKILNDALEFIVYNTADGVYWDPSGNLRKELSSAQRDVTADASHLVAL